MPSLVLTIPPVLEPVTAAEAITHLRLDAGSFEPVPLAPVVSLAGVGAGGVDNGSHRYCCTFITADGETSAGDVSGAVVVVDKTINGQVVVTGIPIGGNAVIARALYRSTAATPGTYLQVTILNDNETTTYTDTTPDVALGAGVPSTNSTQNPLLTALITAARQDVENFLNRALITQSYRFTLDVFPPRDILHLPRPTLQSVGDITYLDTSGALQTLDPTIYTVDTDHFPGRVVLQYGRYWPFVRAIRNTVFVPFVAGFGDTGADVPRPITAAIKLRLTELWENREPLLEEIGKMSTVGALLWPYRYVKV